MGHTRKPGTVIDIPTSIPYASLRQRWVAGLNGHHGGLALSPAPKESGPASEYVIALPPSVGASA